MQLTREQRAVVHHAGGHARVAAVAGSGKSSTLVERVVHLLEQGTDARRILVVMFNVAAREGFEARLAARLQGRSGPTVRTFHALGLRLCRSLVRAGALPDWSLVSEEWRRTRLIEEALTATEPVLLRQGREQLANRVELMGGFIDRVKADRLSPSEQFELLDFDPELRYFIRAYERFEALRQAQGLRFFHDLISDPVELFSREPGQLALVSDRLEHLIIDEYQDINPIQQQLVRYLAGARAAVMAVGDADQCIYAWRGADPSFMAHRFDDDFPGGTLYHLSYTFRYGHRLSLAANHVIRHNHPDADGPLCLSHHRNPDSRIDHALEESGSLVEHLRVWCAQGRSLVEAALLVRLYSMSAGHELALLEADIPYHLEGRARVLEQAEIGALCGHLALAAGRLLGYDAERRRAHIHQMLTIPPLGLGRERVEQLERAILAHPDNAPALMQAVIPANAHRKQRERLTERVELWRALAKGERGNSLAALLRRICTALRLDEGLTFGAGRAEVAEERKLLVEGFIRFAQRSDLALEPFLDRLDDYRSRREQGEALLITSIHRAKGLEWPLVIVPGLEEGRFPFYSGMQPDSELDDERRLYYVAITRAREQLLLLHPDDELFEHWREQGSDDAPWSIRRGCASRFLYESNLRLSTQAGAALVADSLPAEPIEAVECRVARRYLAALGTGLQLRHVAPRPLRDERREGESAPTEGEWRRGMRVAHERFGSGVVVAVNPQADKLQVRFEREGLKWLATAYAKLRRI